MTTIDVLILAFTAAMAVGGFTRGAIVSALSLAGFAAGTLIGTRIASGLVNNGSASPYTPLFGLIGAMLVGAVFSAALEILGLSLRRALSGVPGLRVIDGALGAVVGAALALGICWIAGSVALQTPGLRDDLRADVQRSSVLRRLNDTLPPSGRLLHALARFDPFPSINGPDAGVAAPPRGIARKPAIRAAAASVVRVTGTACGLGIEGSGWIAAPGVVVTNAHVVAGEDDTAVQLLGEGERLRAHAIAFDSRNDIAVLGVPGLGGAPALRLASDPAEGTAGAILGFPHNGPYNTRSARLGPTSDVLASDAYGRGPLTRSISSFRGVVKSGNSGGPVVDTHGHVLATVFAKSSGSGHKHTGYGVPNKVVRKVLKRAGSHVSTGPCAQ